MRQKWINGRLYYGKSTYDFGFSIVDSNGFFFKYNVLNLAFFNIYSHQLIPRNNTSTVVNILLSGILQ